MPRIVTRTRARGKTTSAISSEPSIKLKDLAADADGEVWGINDDNTAVRWDSAQALWVE